MVGMFSRHATSTGPRLLTGVARAARDGNFQGAVPPQGLARMGVGGDPVSWLACVHTAPRQQAHGY